MEFQGSLEYADALLPYSVQAFPEALFPRRVPSSFEQVASLVSVQHLVRSFPSSCTSDTLCSSASDTLFRASLKVSDLNYDD